MCFLQQVLKNKIMNNCTKITYKFIVFQIPICWQTSTDVAVRRDGAVWDQNLRWERTSPMNILL